MNESTLYARLSSSTIVLIVAVYVDDLLVTRLNDRAVHDFKSQMMSMFEMMDLGTMTYFLGMKVIQTSEGVYLHQVKYARDLLKKFNMSLCKVVNTSLAAGEKFSKEDGTTLANGSICKSMIGSLLYLTATRPNLMYATCLLSKFMQAPTILHFIAVKRILKYVKGTADFGLRYMKQDSGDLVGYGDSDWAGHFMIPKV